MLKLEVHDLSRKYGDVVAVRGINLDVRDSEIFGLLGPNGAGKTTTLECLIGLRQPDGGSIRISGIDARAHPEQIKQRIGVQLQATALPDKITPREALKLFSSFYHRRARVDRLIERFSLIEKADAPFDSLSGGQRQRLALALAFVNEPEILFLDEPTAGLDPQSRRQLHEAIRQMRDEGRSVIIATHYMDEAEALCDRVAIMNRGQIVALGAPADLAPKARILPRILLRTTRMLPESWIMQIPGTISARLLVERWEITTANVSQTITALVGQLEEEGNDLIDLQIYRATLEDLFVELTGNTLIDREQPGE